MLKLRNKIFSILMMIGIVLCLVSCFADSYVKLEFDEESYTVNVGESLELKPNVIQNSDSFVFGLVYESADETIATYTDGKLVGVSEGTTTIKVHVKDKATVFVTAQVTVTPSKALEVKFNVPSNMVEGETKKITYTKHSESDDILVTYKSLDETVVTVDSDGNVTAVLKGHAQIVAKVTVASNDKQSMEYVFDIEVSEEVFEIKYELNGGENHPDNPTSYTRSQLPLTFVSPSKTGYTFDGWYDNPDFSGKAITELGETTRGNLNLYAKWTPTKYTITYELDGGVNHPDNPAGYDVVLLPIKLLPATKEGAKFLGWYLNGELVEELKTGLTGNITLVAKWEQEVFNISYDLDEGECEGLPTKYTKGVVTPLPTPTKAGFRFVGWELNGTIITEISAEQTGDIKLVAKWEKVKDLIVDPNNPDCYATIEEALEAANDGDTIQVVAGTYEGFKITKSVTILGANQGINPVTSTRGAETVFTGDIIVSANNVTLDGIALTGNGRIKGGDSGAKNVVVTNVYVFASTTNPTTADSKNAPLYFSSTSASVTYEDLVFTNIKYNNDAKGRPMIFYGGQIVNLTIDGCEFVSPLVKSNYNDGIKINEGFGTKGHVVITNNYFKNYGQYVIWFSQYAEGTYEIKNNVFDNCGQTAGSHAAVTFAANYNGAPDAVTNIYFQYNTVDNSYMALRLDESTKTPMSAATHNVHVNYNKILNCSATYYIWNKNTSFEIDGAFNYYDKTPVATKFSGIDGWEFYYEDANDVPAYTKEISEFFEIEWVLDDGDLQGIAPNRYDTVHGLSKLPVPTKGGATFAGWYLNGELVEEIKKGQTGKVTLVAKWRADALYVGQGEQYETLGAALEAAQDGDKIVVLAGEYDENVTISVANLTIVGPNQGVDANGKDRQAEAVLKGVIKVLAAAKNLTIDGFAFTGNAQVIAGEDKDYHNFRFMNNLVYDTKDATSDWVLSRYTMNAFIQFRFSANAGTANSFYFANNKFVNVKDVNVMVNKVKDLSFDNNTFIDFGRDAIRSEGGVSYGIFSFTNNYFEQTVKGNGYNGIFFYSIAATPGGAATTLLIKNNTFKQLGTSDSKANPYNGAISSHVYQEAKLDIEIENNIFDHCYNYLWLRNNGAKETTWSCKVNNNQFLGLPTTNYFGTYQGNDNSSTNPHLAEFGANYYEDNDGNVITDLEPYKDYFKHLKTYGTALGAKPGESESDPVHFYTINYLLDGGLLKGEYPTSYTNRMTEAITLPTPTKNNHVFLGWRINGKGEYVTEIPVGSTGDIVLVAEWMEMAGEVYDVTYKFEGGYSEELLIAYADTAATSLEINNYNQNDRSFWGGAYETDIFITTSAKDPGAAFSDRIYIGKNKETGLYEVVGIIPAGPKSEWASGAEFLISISSSYKGPYKAEISGIMAKVKVGQKLAFDTPIEDISTTNPGVVYFFDSTPENGELKVGVRAGEKMITATQLGYDFLGWYDQNNKLWSDFADLNSDLTLTAKWKEKNPVTSIKVDAICDDLEKGQTFQIIASVEPSDAYFKQLFYSSSNSDVLEVSETGLLTAKNVGRATITISDYLNKVTYTKEIIVYAVASLDISFDEHYNGALKPNENLQIIAKAFGKGMENATFTYESSDPNVLTVSETGLITAIANGKANVKVSIVGTSINLTVCITVATYSEDTDIDRLIALLAKNNFSVVEVGNISLYDDGTQKVYVPVWGSVNKFLFDEFYIDETYYERTENNPNNHKARRSVDTIEFVTVHDTATLTGTVESIASNMSGGETSIHYTVGNDKIFGVVPEKYIAYHAGDGTTTTFTWTKTDAPATSNVAPKYDIVQVGTKSYLKVNDTVTTIEIPALGSTGRTPTASDLTHLGPVWKVEGGYYWIGGPLWYSYSQIASHGGNNNSIGIEMCSNLSGDIYDTFQRTARLVVDILIRNKLDTTRVKMHNTWSGKNCPQSVIAGDYWDNFMEMVELQYEIQTKYSDAKITMKSNNPEIVDNTGRVVNAPMTTTTVSYEITVQLGGETRTITLYSVIPGATTWEQWEGTYPTSKIWNNGKFAL